MEYAGGISCNSGKYAIGEWLIAHTPLNGEVLDIGAGAGTYAVLLQQYPVEIDAVEAFEPSIQYIIDKYRTIYCVDICKFQYLQNYDTIIMGDVLEHLSAEDGPRVVKEALEHCRYLMVAVPFTYEQGAIANNTYEIHRQTDLNFKVMAERYPELHLLMYFDTIVQAGDAIEPIQYAYYYAKGALDE